MQAVKRGAVGEKEYRVLVTSEMNSCPIDDGCSHLWKYIRNYGCGKIVVMVMVCFGKRPNVASVQMLLQQGLVGRQHLLSSGEGRSSVP
jgi:hypothetical protein